MAIAHHKQHNELSARAKLELDKEISVSITRCSHQVCCCPLRLNQVSSTTSPAGSITSSRRSNMRPLCTGRRSLRKQLATHDEALSGAAFISNIIGHKKHNTCTSNDETIVKTTGGQRRRCHGNHQYRCNDRTRNYYFSPSLRSCLLLSLLFTIFVQAKLSLAATADQLPIFSSSSSNSGDSRYNPNALSSSSQLATVAAGANSGPSLCPLVPSCHCKWANGKRGAFCSRRNLAAIPDNLLPEIQLLEMSGNPLIHLNSRVFQDKHLTNLQKLHLSDCKLSYIAEDAFAHLTNLIELDLSHNHLQSVPSASFWAPKYSLRRLSLAFNPIQSVEPEAFAMLDKLTTLDLSNCQLSQLKANSFNKLVALKELKLAENNLTQLPLSVVSGVREFAMVDLFGNPWHCDCELRQSMDWMKRHHMQLPIEPTCATPLKFKDQRWISIKADEFFCPPSVLNKHNELTVGAGSNVSLACSARGTPPLTFIWFQDEKNLTTARANSSEAPASTKLLEERRYEIAEEISPGNSFGSPNVTTSILYLYDLKLTDTSLFLCWVDNIAGSSFANFSLVVNDSPPYSASGNVGVIGSAGGAGSWIWRSLGQPETQMSIVIIGFVILLAAAILLLLLVKHNNSAGGSGNRSSKSSQSSDFKSSTIKSNNGNGGVISSANKFSHPHLANHRRNDSMLTDSESQSDDATNADSDDDAGERQSTSSNSSCRKNAKVMGAGELDGFIEHMRSGIINMDYHSMSPVIQFNNTLKGNNSNSNNTATGKQAPQSQQQQQQQQQHHYHHHQQQQQQQHQLHLQQPYLASTAMHHFPSASNASSIPGYYGNGGGGNRSASMATTTSDLSPSSGSMSVNFATTGNVQQPTALTATTNCDLQQQQQRIHLAAVDHLAPLTVANNATSASYTSDYQSGYSAAEDPAMLAAHHHHQLMYDPMLTDGVAFHQHRQQFSSPQGHLFQASPLNAPSRPQSLVIHPMDQQQQQQQEDLILQNMMYNGGGGGRLAPSQRNHSHLDNQLHIL